MNHLKTITLVPPGPALLFQSTPDRLPLHRETCPFLKLQRQCPELVGRRLHRLEQLFPICLGALARASGTMPVPQAQQTELLPDVQPAGHRIPIRIDNIGQLCDQVTLGAEQHRMRCCRKRAHGA